MVNGKGASATIAVSNTRPAIRPGGGRQRAGPQRAPADASFFEEDRRCRWKTGSNRKKVVFHLLGTSKKYCFRNWRRIAAKANLRQKNVTARRFCKGGPESRWWRIFGPGIMGREYAPAGSGSRPGHIRALSADRGRRRSAPDEERDVGIADKWIPSSDFRRRHTAWHGRSLRAKARRASSTSSWKR